MPTYSPVIHHVNRYSVRTSASLTSMAHLFSLVLLLAGTPLFAAIASERPIAEDALDVAPFSRSAPRAASNDDGSLVIWSDGREGLISKLMGARISADGVLLDPTGFVITRAATDYDLVATGDSYLVVWSNDWYRQEIFAAVISASGEVRPNPANPVASGILPKVAWNGSRALLAFASSNFDPRIGASLLDAEGSPLRTIAAWTAGFKLAVGSDGDGFLVAWDNGNGQVVTQAFTRTAEALGGEQISDNAGEYPGRIEIASDGTRYIVLWSSNKGFRIRTVTPSGQPDGAIGEISSSGPEIFVDPSMTWTGANYLLACGSYLAPDFLRSKIFALSLDRDGRHDGPPLQIATTSRDQRSPAITWNGRAAPTVWLEASALPFSSVSTQAVVGTFLGSGGIPAPDFEQVLSKSIAMQEQFASASGGDVVLTAWTERSGLDQRRRVFVGRMDAALRPLDGRGHTIVDSDSNQQFPVVSFDGQNFLIVWYEDARVRAARVTPSGEVLDRHPIELGDALAALFTSSRVIAATWNGQAYAIVWPDGHGVLVAARLTRFGVLLDPIPREVSTGTVGGDVEPSIAWNGSEYFAAWTSLQPLICGFECPPFQGFVRGVRLSSELMPGIEQYELGAPGSQRPSVATDGVDFVTVWDDYNGIRLQRMTDGRFTEQAGGAILGSGYDSRVLWTGFHYIVSSSFGHPFPDVEVRVLNRSTLVTEKRQLLATSDDRELGAVPLILPGGSAAVGYQRFSSELPYLGVSRIFIQKYADRVRGRVRRGP